MVSVVVVIRIAKLALAQGGKFGAQEQSVATSLPISDCSLYDAAVVADGSSVAEEIANLARLRNDGDITEDEYRRLKTKLV